MARVFVVPKSVLTDETLDDGRNSQCINKSITEIERRPSNNLYGLICCAVAAHALCLQI